MKACIHNKMEEKNRSPSMVIWCSNIQIMWKNVWKLKHFRVQSYLNQPSFLVKLILNFTSFRYLNNLHQGSRRWMTENKWGIRIRRMMAYTVDNLRSSRSCIYTRYTKTVSFQMEAAIWTMNITILETHQSQDHARDEQQPISLTLMRGSSHSRRMGVVKHRKVRFFFVHHPFFWHD